MAKRRRVRSPHPGVKLKKRVRGSGLVTWRAHYIDPDTGREVAKTLDPKALSTREARTQWAKALSLDLARRRMDRLAGIRPVQVVTIDDGISKYLETAEALLKEKTLEGHNLAFAKLSEWATHEGVLATADLTPAKLASLKDYLVRSPRLNVRRGGSQGSRTPSAQRRSPVTINRELRSLKTLLNTWRKHGLLADLHRDDISDALAALTVPREEPVFHSSATLRRILAAAVRHDAECFAETRDEHAGLRPPGSTRRYAPITPFVAFLLLTGCRRGEALALPWQAVDLDAVDHQGRRVGEIRLDAAVTKTQRARTIGLEVSPALRKLLASMKLRFGNDGHVFGGGDAYTVDTVVKARRRLISAFGAPDFTWQSLRSTCATYLTNAPGIFGAATVFMSAKQLGHSVAVAERHYLGVHRGIPRDAHTLEAAMQIESPMSRILTRITDRTLRAKTA
ncbi:MAG: hypothetical protein H6719_00315 [Sandaracinaceae bacterium]|nr:hypothetical protein [Sandaracinaceae bacterium]